ncbi:MAG: glycosyltransferase family 92 protein [Oscillospiraceae bacterium]|nr:glycosyltransferase family 92 protein [Oscillospiraceae bacterium]
MKYEDKYFIYDDPQPTGLKSCIKNVFTDLKAAVYKVLMDLQKPAAGTQKKYRVSICAIFKNEAPYIREWIEFHKIVGVDHFYMYNNNSDDDYASVLQPYVENGDVTLVQWPHDQAQMRCYRDCIENYRQETQWLGFIDLDEFIVPKSTHDIYSYLQPFEKNRGSVAIYWKLFGTSGRFDRDTEGLVTEDFTVCWKKHCNIGKCFYNTSYDFDGGSDRNACLHHIFWANWKGRNYPPVNLFDQVCLGNRHKATAEDFPIQINHYFTKSYMEYAAKRAKGDVYFKINPHDEAYFYHHEMQCTSTDHSAYKYLIKLKQAMKKGR